MKILIISTLFLGTAFTASFGQEEVDTVLLAKKLTSRIEILQKQFSTIVEMISDGKPYQGLAKKPIKLTLLALTGSQEPDDMRFLKALEDIKGMDGDWDLHMLTPEDLLQRKKGHISASVKFLESRGIDLAKTEKQKEVPKTTISPKSVSDLFKRASFHPSSDISLRELLLS